MTARREIAKSKPAICSVCAAERLQVELLQALYNFRRGVCLRLLPLVFCLTVVLAAQSPEAIEVASIKLDDQHSSSTSFRFLPGGGVHVQGATLANMVLFPYDLRESSLECEFLL